MSQAAPGIHQFPARKELGKKWPLNVWSCWWLAVNMEGPPLDMTKREAPGYARPTPHSPALD